MSHDDFNFEPIRGLPEKLPEGEEILWQGAPLAGALAREALLLRWVAGYFVLVAVWRVGVSSSQYPMNTALGHAVPIVIAGVMACLLLYLVAYIQARATVYTLTNKRVAMRVGAALTMTLNLPYVCIANAHLDLRRGGSGTIAFELTGNTRLNYMMTWPHVRPWYINRTQPALRCIPDAQAVAELFAEAAETRINAPMVTRSDQSGGDAVALQ